MALKEIDGYLVKKIAERIPKCIVHQLTERWRVARQAHREAADKALAWETMRRGLTPATELARVAWENHRIAMYEAKQVRDAAKKELDESRQAARAAEQRFRDAQATYGAIFRAFDPTGQADLDARAARKRELEVTRAQAKRAQEEAERADRVLVANLREVYLVYPRQETALALAQLLGAPESQLMVLMGLRKKRELNDGERQEIITRRLAGTPETILAAEYQITPRWVREILRMHTEQHGPAS